MAKDIVPPSFEAKENNENPRYPRRGDVVFCPLDNGVSIFGIILCQRPLGMVKMQVDPYVDLTVGAERVDVVLRPKQ